MSLQCFLNEKNITRIEGHCQLNSQQVEDLILLTNKPNIKVMEIGFNAGHSAETFLKNNKDLSLISFDIGVHEYVKTSKEFIDNIYPNRHTLILGNSKETIPEFIKNNKNTKFDVVFIDGAHDYETAKIDVENCFHLFNLLMQLFN
jgi:predicted O-methyltransferase YrrM